MQTESYRAPRVSVRSLAHTSHKVATAAAHLLVLTAFRSVGLLDQNVPPNGAGTTPGMLGYMFWAAEYPMMTDFPSHAASSSIFRHYLDAGWHFREQFVFQLFAVPYATLYLLSALFMWVFRPIVATKVAAAVMLAVLPAGLMVLCWGLRKSPLLGLWGLVPVWGVVSHWGFIH